LSENCASVCWSFQIKYFLFIIAHPFHFVKDLNNCRKLLQRHNNSCSRLARANILQFAFILRPSLCKLQLQDIQTLVGGDAVENKSIANFIFEIDYTEDDDEKFRKRCGDKGVFYAYHGSKAENFYSILRTGLRNNLNKVLYFFLICDVVVSARD